MTNTPPPWGAIGLGTWEFGSHLPPDRCRDLLDTHADIGGQLIDTAPTYGPHADGSHHAESIIGDWLATTGTAIQVATKAGLNPATRRPDLAPPRLLLSADRSRDRLRRPHLDLLLLHRDDPQVPVDELADTLNRLVTTGTTTAIGVSNWQPARLDALATRLAASGHAPLHATAPLWSLARRSRTTTDPELVEASPEHLACARTHRLHVLPYRAAALGFFATTPHHEGGRHHAYQHATYHTPDNLARHQRARRLARTLGATPHQVALAWLCSSDLPVTPVVGATTPAQLRESAAGCVLRLTDDHRRYLTGGGPL
ncbi:aldo/keto reductase [Micromonospora sp. CA-263727]|uniref:aldo/keto reductase n=1 Tax=Micromonospora sp. CA-263727 TaxID=3239967 RepID=UPI003D8DFA2B